MQTAVAVTSLPQYSFSQLNNCANMFVSTGFPSRNEVIIYDLLAAKYFQAGVHQSYLYAKRVLMACALVFAVSLTTAKGVGVLENTQLLRVIRKVCTGEVIQNKCSDNTVWDIMAIKLNHYTSKRSRVTQPRTMT
jgi:hypothetical protein